MTDPNASDPNAYTVSTPSPADPVPRGQPRALRNNNPGDLKSSIHSPPWQGQTGLDANNFVMFDTAEDGWRALGYTICVYWWVHELNDPYEFSKRYDSKQQYGYGISLAEKLRLNNVNSCFDHSKEGCWLLAKAISQIESPVQWDYHTAADGVYHGWTAFKSRREV